MNAMYTATQLGGTLLVTALSLAPQIVGAQSVSTVCSFTRGPLAGESRNMALQAPQAIGAPCTDGQSSRGTISVAASGSPVVTRASQIEGSGLSTTCVFTRGPLTGLTKDIAPQVPQPVGALCTDGQSSRGTIK